jgi:hypothetical protein
VSGEISGGSELTKLMTNHIFYYIYGHVFLTVVNRDSMTDKFGEYSGRARPGFDNSFFALVVHVDNSAVEFSFDIRAFFDASAHF